MMKYLHYNIDTEATR